MGVLYLLEPQTVVHKEGGRFVIKKGRDVLKSVHIFKLDQVVVMGPVTISPAVWRTLLREGIDTIFMDRLGRYLGRLQGPEGKNILLRKAQFDRLSSSEFVLQTAKAIIKGKLKNQRVILQRLQRSHRTLSLSRQIAELKRFWEKAENASSLDELRGYEGQAAAIYFPAWGKGLKVNWTNFTGRTRRPPRDPVNALLSLGYTLLLNTVISSVCTVGMDPYIGALHSVEYGRPSLALDLMEEWRPVIVDGLVLSVFNLGVVNSRDFQTKIPSGEEIEYSETNYESGIYLTDSGWRKYIAQFERKMTTEITFHLNDQQSTYRDAIRLQVRHFAKYLQGDENRYQPVPLK